VAILFNLGCGNFATGESSVAACDQARGYAELTTREKSDNTGITAIGPHLPKKILTAYPQTRLFFRGAYSVAQKLNKNTLT
jgi:hypothetical protein